jgi:hypothetical protein
MSIIFYRVGDKYKFINHHMILQVKNRALYNSNTVVKLNKPNY